MKRKGRSTLEIIMWLRVCYNREALFFCIPPLLLFSERKHSFNVGTCPQKMKVLSANRGVSSPWHKNPNIPRKCPYFCGAI